jgi:SAM-dependent methyltransferase
MVEDRLLPWALADVELGRPVLELGPGYGVTTRLLVDRTDALTAVEVDPKLAARLERKRIPGLTVLTADATELPLPDDSFSAVVCFTMLHHLPSPQAQDRLFAEAFRVLRPSGVFAGSDSVANTRFRLLHVADTLTPVAPEAVPRRLGAVGFTDVDVSANSRAYRFRARRPSIDG